MQEIRDPACLETLYRKLELSSRTRTAKRPRRSFPGVDPKTAEADACRIEHIISDESFSRLKEAAAQEQE